VGILRVVKVFLGVGGFWDCDLEMDSWDKSLGFLVLGFLGQSPWVLVVHVFLGFSGLF
jgi:hypothetical protein